jgi:hypothetical protein
MKGSLGSRMMSGFSDTLERTVNKDLVNIRKYEDLVIYIDELMKEAEKQLGNGVIMKYLGWETADNYQQVLEVNRNIKAEKKSKNDKSVSIEETYARIYVFKIKLNYRDEERNIGLRLEVPLICDDGNNYLIKGCKYCIPFQLVDSVISTHIGYANKKKLDEVSVKTMMQPLQMQRFEKDIKDMDGMKYSTHYMNLKLNNRVSKVPFVLFYFALFGFYNTLRYFGMVSTDRKSGCIRLFDELPENRQEEYPDWIFFQFGQMYLAVYKSMFHEEPNLRCFVATILQLNKRSVNGKNIRYRNYWLDILGTHLSINNSIQSGHSLITTFKNSVDARTLKNIEKYEGKKLRSAYEVVRWMFNTFSVQILKGGGDLDNKRLRLGEYIIEPLRSELKSRIFGFFEARGGYSDMKKLENVFKVKEDFLISEIISSKSRTNSNAIGRFMDNVNDFSIVNTISKGTQTGPGAVSASSKYVSDDLKKITPSMVERMDIFTASPNAPGSSFNIAVGCNIDPDLMNFKPQGSERGKK